jgi:spore maturation protein CgeB
MERWFEPGQEVLIASTSEAAADAYRDLLADPAAAEDMGRRARARALDEHTYVQRARRLLELIGLASPTKRSAAHA